MGGLNLQGFQFLLKSQGVVSVSAEKKESQVVKAGAAKHQKLPMFDNTMDIHLASKEL